MIDAGSLNKLTYEIYNVPILPRQKHKEFIMYTEHVVTDLDLKLIKWTTLWIHYGFLTLKKCLPMMSVCKLQQVEDA